MAFRIKWQILCCVIYHDKKKCSFVHPNSVTMSGLFWTNDMGSESFILLFYSKDIAVHTEIFGQAEESSFPSLQSCEHALLTDVRAVSKYSWGAQLCSAPGQTENGD